MQNIRCTHRIGQFVQWHIGNVQHRWFSEIIPRSKYSEVSPSIIYEIVWPYFNSMIEERQHRQIAEAFEAKNREALIRYLKENRFSFRELDRVIKVDGKPIAEWEICVWTGRWWDFGFWNANIVSLPYSIPTNNNNDFRMLSNVSCIVCKSLWMPLENLWAAAQCLLLVRSGGWWSKNGRSTSRVWNSLSEWYRSLCCPQYKRLKWHGYVVF